jgi:hypothetical protein
MQVSYVLPDVFEECIIRLYCKIEDPSQESIVRKVTKAFGEWCREKGYPLPQVGLHKNSRIVFIYTET